MLVIQHPFLSGDTLLGELAIFFASINVFGGFFVTHRMLAMFVPSNKGGDDDDSLGGGDSSPSSSSSSSSSSSASIFRRVCWLLTRRALSLCRRGDAQSSSAASRNKVV
jgi:hypothetical protein